MSPDSLHCLTDFLDSVSLFQGLGQEFLSAIATAVEPVHFSAHQICLQEGDRSDCLFVILSGAVRVMPRGAEASKNAAVDLPSGASIGEVGFLTCDKRSATVTTLDETCLLKLTRPAFDALTLQFPRETAEVTNRIVLGARKIHLSSALRRSELFGSVDAHVLHDLEAELDLINLASGETLFRRGEPGDAMYLIIAGRLRVSVPLPNNTNEGIANRDAHEKILAELHPGDTLGEMAVLTGEPRSASVYAFRDTQLARLSRDGFQRLLQKYPDVLSLFFTRKMAGLMREQISGAAPRSSGLRTVAVIPAHPAAPLKDFCVRFTRALAALDSTVHVSSEFVDSALDRTGASQSQDETAGEHRVTEWLNSLEEQFRYVVYEADSHDSNWTRRCLRQADTYNRPGPPSATKNWLAQRPGYRHHHVRLASSDDLARIARFFTGRAVGLVLGGGFARGIAHVGVLQALAEAQVPIDLIGGTSMGAIVAGMWAIGVEREKMIEYLRAGGMAAFRDFTVPFVSFTTGQKMWDIVDKVGGETQIEDLWQPYFCVSAILNRAEIKVHTRGSLTKSVLASSRAPGVFPPVVWDDDLLVDGGIVNNVPVDVMKEFSNGGIVIAVDVSPAPESARTEDYGMALSGVRLLLNRLNPFSASIYPPSIIKVLMKTIDFSSESYRRKVADAADLYIRLPLVGFRFDDFKRSREMADTAYRESIEMIRSWTKQPQSQPQKKTA
ncbi:MAG: cyclic nucleotide-binding domain-containing protein [Terriglobales bacterium]